MTGPRLALHVKMDFMLILIRKIVLNVQKLSRIALPVPNKDAGHANRATFNKMENVYLAGIS